MTIMSLILYSSVKHINRKQLCVTENIFEKCEKICLKRNFNSISGLSVVESIYAYSQKEIWTAMENRIFSISVSSFLLKKSN